MRPVEEKAQRVLARAYFGIHHVPYWNRRRGWGPEGVKVTVYGDVSTCDFDTLTRLVVAAHDECVRLRVMSGGPSYLVLAFTDRAREGDITERHPTMEEALERARGGWQRART